MSSRHGRTKQYGPDSGAYPKLPPPHGNNTYNGRTHQNHLLQQQHHLQHNNQQQQYAVDLQPNMRGTLPRQNHHHHSLPRNAWSVDRHSPVSSTNSSNDKGFPAANHLHHNQQQYRRSRHRVYGSQRQIASKTRSHKGGGTTTSDPDALSSVTTAGNKFSHRPMGVWTESPAPVLQQTATSAPSPPPPSALQPQFVPPLPPQNIAPYPIGPCITTAAAATTTVRQPSSVAPAVAVRHQPAAIMPACDVAVDACGGRCPRFENFCHFCLLIFYFSGITVGFMLIMSAIVSTRDPRFLYIGCLMLPVSAFLLAVQCRVRQDADRRKRHRQLNGRHRTIGASATVVNTHPPPAIPDAIPLQNMIMVGNDTLRRQYQGHVYQYVGQKDNESTYTNQYDSANVQQIDGVPWWRRDDNRVYHNNHAAPHS
ncbi:uncharacterized protein LOC126905698 [Daktulosphaira vitifoliae]|uniref:uncharacterized protein LOC126905698 n=1 Tax=Daktulosphaira vitifoliae TaxID=58002 RepID=UPI0021AADCB7|nr:uncharacterized protein LOC126905698 [Daktulosphaira vitifoliae]